MTIRTSTGGASLVEVIDRTFEGPGILYVTVSIPAESVITLPTPALEIKRISKMVKITQCRFFNAIPPIATGKPADTVKLFL